MAGPTAMDDTELLDEVGDGQIEIELRRMECSYAVRFSHDGRKRIYQHISGTVVKTNKEWQEMQRRFLNLQSRDGEPVELHLADGKIAHGYLQIKDFGPGAPGRKVLRFAVLTHKPGVQAV